MGSARSKSRLTQLWQLPLLLLSLGLFAYAAFLFIDPKGGPTLGQRIEFARMLLKQERFEAAIEQLNGLLAKEKLKPELEGAVRILLGEALELGQKQKHLAIPENYVQIIQQTKLGLSLGIAADAASQRRLGESYEALGRADEAILHYRQAAKLDAGHALKWQRKVIELQLLMHEKHDGAAESIEEYLKQPGLANGERAWALGEKAHLLVDAGKFAEAAQILTEASKLEGEGGEQGPFTYWLGYSQWKLGNAAEAERLLRVARDLLRVQHPMDADAAYALGLIREGQKDYAGANSFYAAILQSHLDSPLAPAAKLHRGMCRVALGEADAGLSDLHDVTRLVSEKQSLPPRLKDEVVEGLRQSIQVLSNQANYQGALEVLAYEQELRPKPSADFLGRLARIYERRAEQLDVSGADALVGTEASAPHAGRLNGEGNAVPMRAPAPQAKKREEQARDCRVKAGDAYVAVSRALTLADDKGHGQALWKGIELYDQGGDLPRMISALETFVAERPEDPQTPDALLKLGQSLHAAGLFDKAIEAYRKNQFRYPKSLAASKSAVPLARAYIAKGPEAYVKAEQTLRALIEDNVQVTPQAEEFRESLWELANLYYRTGRFELGIARLEEMTQRYPNDDRMGQLLFLMADSYRKGAMNLEEKMTAAKGATTQPAIDLAEGNTARSDRLKRARGLYDDVVAHYRKAGTPREADRLYLKLSMFYRADCMYDLGDYKEAIALYGDAAFRYQDDASSLAAYVQIVNANVALGKLDEAKAANERAKWMLRRMPAEAFAAGSFGVPRQYWDEWLKWAGEAGMWR